LLFQYLNSQLTAKLLAVQFSVFCTINQINLSQFKIPRFLFKKSSEYHMISRDSALHKNQVRLTVSYTNSPYLVFLVFSGEQVFETSNGFHGPPYISKYHHTNFQTSIHSNTQSAAQTVNRRPFDQKSQQTVKNEIFCQHPYFVKGFFI